MILDIEPHIRVGEFMFGQDINEYLKKYPFIFTPEDKSTGWETYTLEKEGLVLFTERKSIVSILCEKNCHYKEYELINSNINDFLIHLEDIKVSSIDEIFVTDDILQFVYEIDELGFQIWCEQNIIKTVILSNLKET
jgi:hypothetical protein